MEPMFFHESKPMRMHRVFKVGSKGIYFVESYATLEEAKAKAISISKDEWDACIVVSEGKVEFRVEAKNNLEETQ